MYLNVMVTILAVLVLFWILHDVVFLKLFNTPLKGISKYMGKSPEYFDQSGQIHAAFEKGDFQQALKICDEILKDRPYESSALNYKAYSLYHLKRLPEAKEAFELLNTLPNQDCSKMIEKINAMES